MTNRFLPHVLILCEDKADLEIVNAFLLEVPEKNGTRVQALQPAGGWNVVVELFCNDYAASMMRYPERLFILVIDFDGKEDRLIRVKQRIPVSVIDRVFVLGVRMEPEDLRSETKLSYEELGSAIAIECRDGGSSIWEHDLLNNNAGELLRIRDAGIPELLFT